MGYGLWVMALFVRACGMMACHSLVVAGARDGSENTLGSLGSKVSDSLLDGGAPQHLSAALPTG